jgi:F5/8 type C domain
MIATDLADGGSRTQASAACRRTSRVVATAVAAVFAVAGSGVTPSAARASGPLAAGPFGTQSSVEVPGLRTRTSRTYRNADGTRVAHVFTSSVNYRGRDGRWQRIDSALVGSGRSGYALRNAANRFSLHLPARLEGEPVRFESGDAWIEFALEGARGGAPVVEGAVARYRDALPDVDLTYEVQQDGVKENVVLDSPSAPSRYVFTLRTSPGLRPQVDYAGGISFVTRSGDRAFGFAPPSLVDAAGDFSHAAKMTLSRNGDSYRVALSADREWLDEPGRSWPVMLDPTVNLASARGCAYIRNSGGSSTQCDNPMFVVDNTGGAAKRPLIKFDVAAGVPAQALVLSARMRLFARDAGPQAIDLYPVTKPWTLDAGWTRYDSVNNWATQGGDWDPSGRVSVLSPVNGYTSWYVSDLAQAWLDGTRPNHGVIMVGPLAQTSQFSRTSPSELPYMEVIYEPRIGDLPAYTFQRFQRTNELVADVNVANGNLLVREEDVAFDDSDLEYDVRHYYNRQSTGYTPAGRRWTLGKGSPDVRLEILGDGVAFYGPTGYAVPFRRVGDGTYRSPAGVDADLRRNADGTYTLTWRDSGDRLHFTSVGRLTSEVDTGEGTIRYAYDGTPTLLRSITDTEDRTTSAAYDSGNWLSELRRPTAVHVFGHGASGDPGNLTSYRAPSGRQTRYTYSGEYMSRIQDYAGGDLTIGYDASHRVSTITRTSSSGSQVTQFTYGAGTTTVSGGGVPTSTYNYDRELLVRSSTIGGSPPSLTLAGTLYDRREQTLGDRTSYNLNVSASESSGVDIEIAVDGDEADFAEQSCTQGCGTFTRDWEFHTDEYPAGEYVVTVAAVDHQGDERTQTFKVTVPPKPAESDSGDRVSTRDERFTRATAFRQSFGFASDATTVNATLDDPALAASATRWGAPLTTAEEAELSTRLDVADELDVVDRYGSGAGAADFAGVYLDQDAGSLVYVGWTANATTHMEALRQRFPYATRLRSFAATRTSAQLAALKAQVAADGLWFAQQGIDVRSHWTDVEGNRIQVGAASPTSAQQTLVTSRFGPGVELVPRDMPSLTRHAAVRPLIAGLRIFRADERSCTSNVNVYGDRSTGRRNRKRRYFTMTAGHCATHGERLFQSASMQPGERRAIGRTAHSYLQAANDRGTPETPARITADLAIIDTRANGRRPPAVTFAGTNDPPGAGPWPVVRTGLIGPVPLSVGRPATATSQESGATRPDRAVDADGDTRWRSATFAAGNQTQTWQVDLENEHDVDRVRVVWDDEFARDYRVETSTDGTNWTTRATVTGVTAPGIGDHRFARVRVRHMRIVMTAAGPQMRYAFSEAEVLAAGESTRTQGDHIGDIVCQSGATSNDVICGVLRIRDADNVHFTEFPRARLDDQKEWSIGGEAVVIRGGDSGGPVFVPRNNRSTRLMIIGINSYGSGRDLDPDEFGTAFARAGFSHMANATAMSQTRVCTRRTCRRR